jgi:Na+-translocating ferredoxin:NAD+ oxidoreductase RnfG subunit
MTTMRYLHLTPALPALVATALMCGSGSAFATQYLSVEQAQQVMFGQADSFKASQLHLTAAQMAEVEKLAGLPARSAAWRVFAAYRGDQLLGHIVLDDVIGKFELISYAVALLPDGSIKQVEILSYRESHGYEIKSKNWRKQFMGKSLKPSANPAERALGIGDGIANISGATLSCTHVTDGVRRIAAIAQAVLIK